jgi:hypothetical protein
MQCELKRSSTKLPSALNVYQLSDSQTAGSFAAGKAKPDGPAVWEKGVWRFK